MQMPDYCMMRLKSPIYNKIPSCSCLAGPNQADLDHLHSVALQPRALSIASSISVNAAHHTGNGGGGSVEAHGVGHISPDDHEWVVLMGEQLGGAPH